MTAPAQAGVLERHAAIGAGADRLLELQNDDGSFPILGHRPDYTPINVQGAIPHGLLESFKATGNLDYLGSETTGVTGARNYLVNHLEENPGVTLTSSGVFFLAEYAVLTGNPEDLDLAREHLHRVMSNHESPEAFINSLVDGRGNMALWDAGRWIRAAHDVGEDELAGWMADALAEQTFVDPFDADADWNEYGLSGLIFGLAESDVIAHQELLQDAKAELLSRQTCDGGFSFTYGTNDPCDSIQSTSFAVMALAFVGDYAAMQPACDFIVSNQNEDGSWDYYDIEYVQTEADALTALSMCMLPLRNGVTSYADAAIGLV